jgi:hypothetical protein
VSRRPVRAVKHCPSAQADSSGAVVIGVVGGTPAEPHVIPLEEAVPVTEELLALTEPVTPGEVLRTAAPCVGCRCSHFKDHRCTLATKVTRELPPVTGELPPCPIRPTCRWFTQEGAEACRRCPQIVTERWHPTPLMSVVAHPTVTPQEAAELAPGVGDGGGGGGEGEPPAA